MASEGGVVDDGDGVANGHGILGQSKIGDVRAETSSGYEDGGTAGRSGERRDCPQTGIHGDGAEVSLLS